MPKQSTPLKSFSPIYQHLLLAVGLFFISLVLYLPSLAQGFQQLWDDRCYVIANPHIHALTLDSVVWMLSAFHCGNWHPLTWFSHALDYQLYGLNPAGHHLSNVLLHSLNVLWFYLFSVLILSFAANTVPLSTAPQRFSIIGASALAALLFAIHPQHVESVTWIAERKDVLCLFFMLPSLIAYLRYVKQPLHPYANTWYWLAVCCHALALLAKPMAVSLPLILWLIDLYPVRRNTFLNSLRFYQAGYFWQVAIRDKYPFIVLSLISVIVTLLAQSETGVVASFSLVPMEVRILNAANSLLIYISKFFFPVSLVPFYPLPIVEYLSWSEQPKLWLALPVVILLASLSIWIYRRQPWWLIAGLFYLITLLPVLGLVQVGSQAFADRYAYLPLLALKLLCASFILYGLLSAHRLIRWGTVLISCLFIGFLTVQTLQQQHIWRDDLSLWTHTVRAFPNSSFAHGNLADAYRLKGEDTQAAQHYYFRHHLSGASRKDYFWAASLERMGEFSQALQVYEAAIKSQQGSETDRQLAQQRVTVLRARLSAATQSKNGVAEPDN